MSLANKLVESHPQQVEDAVEHLCFLTDVNKLYEHALGLYDLELVLLIAQRSQKVCRLYISRNFFIFC
jgi:elongator complex protein 1